MKIFRLLSLLLVVLLASCLNKKKSADTGIPGNESRYVVLAYVTSWGVSTPETSCLTHINYAFGHVLFYMHYHPVTLQLKKFYENCFLCYYICKYLLCL